ncbi:hypothetical protein FBY04_109143 [Pseudomonas sp. SJZ080]|jgi:hypothetical protein|uniref:hypothetical protein n=1 Tax=Pseudomonas sp. SJZ080 TaxID=2572888 RepID=UPI00119B2E4F|nr:hypothetical protein [Pseudomonas sp. SJZ080]TWC55722.1 hypothetical protein FBY04_109143 [Pseudomonas sp. SJZ080]
MSQLPENVYMVVCLNPGSAEGGSPTNCIYTEVKSSTLYPAESGMTEQQLDDLIGAVMYLVVMIIIFGLLKKAIEQ